MKYAKAGPIIIVDDDPEDREMLEEIIRALMPNKIITFKNGREALDYLEATTDKPFIILCDINMPVMDGLRLRDAICVDDHLRRKSIPFVFLTTTADTNSVEKAYLQNVQGFFVKPHSFTTFRKHLQLILEYWETCVHVNSI